MAKAPLPEILKIGFMIGVKIFENIFGILVYESNSVAIKNGRSEGTTEFAQSFSPALVALILLDENRIRQIVKIKNSIDIKFLLILKTNKLNFFI